MKNSLLTIVGGLIIIAAVAWIALKDDGDDSLVSSPTPSPTATSSPSGLFQLAPSDTPSVSVSPSPVATPSSGKVTVSIDDTGFTPSTITIKSGTTVTFVNNGQAMHWVASDPHPIHTGLVGLDARKGLATGETFSFKFTKPGTFGIHDHLSTTLKATILVQ